MTAHIEEQTLGSTGPQRSSQDALDQRLVVLVKDREQSARDLVRAAAIECIRSCSGGSFCSGEQGGLSPQALALALAPFARQHAWRGPVSRWIHSLLGLERVAAEDGLVAPFHELVAEECGLWLEASGKDVLQGWGGRPLGVGLRLAPADGPLAAAQTDLDPEGVVLVASPSDLIEACLVGSGGGRRVILSDGGPTLTGRALARKLIQAGCEVRFAYDSALPGLVQEADAVWVGSETLGAAGFVAPLGTATVLAEAQRKEVPVRLLATPDLVLPGAALELPPWGDSEHWRLWEDPVPRAHLESQPFERVPYSQQLTIACEEGLLRPSEYALAVLDTESPRRLSRSE